MKYFLSILAIFKNEKYAINEWIDHYIMEGVDHFYLIDNGSDDEYKILDKYLDKIDLVIRPEKHSQVVHYNYYLNKTKQESEWVMVVDLDEFMYSRRGYSSIPSLLKKIKPYIQQIGVPWKFFGSSGFIYQPNSIINNFVFRCIANKSINVKCIVRTKYLNAYGIHTSDTTSKNFLNIADYEFYNEGSVNVTEFQLKISPLHLNHYAIQSFEWFKNVKMTRGDVSSTVYETIRDKNYFTDYDKCSVQLDDELSNKNYIMVSNLYKLDVILYGNINYIDITSLDLDWSKSITEQLDDGDVQKKYLIIRKDNILHIF